MSNAITTLALEPKADPSSGRLRRAIRRLGMMFLGIRHLYLLVGLLGLWEYWARSNPSLFLPPVSEIVRSLKDIWFSGSWRHAFLSDLFRKHAVASLERALGGWLIAAVVGVVGGVFLGSWRPARMFFSPIIRFGMSTPSSVMLPVFIALFGITDTMVFALVAMGCTWSILLNTIDGVRTIDSTILMTATSLRLRKRDRLFKVILPGAGPQIMTGLRITLGLSLILVVISELYVSTHGVGYYLGASQRSFKYVPMWSAVFLLALCGLVLNALFALFEGRVLRWHHRSKA